MAFLTDTQNQPSVLHFVAEKFSNLAEQVKKQRAYRKTVAELSNLSNHDLHDLGLNRGDIKRIARETSFAA